MTLVEALKISDTAKAQSVMTLYYVDGTVGDATVRWHATFYGAPAGMVYLCGQAIDGHKPGLLLDQGDYMPRDLCWNGPLFNWSPDMDFAYHGGKGRAELIEKAILLGTIPG